MLCIGALPTCIMQHARTMYKGKKKAAHSLELELKEGC